MAVPAWFDYDYYMNDKLRSVREDDPNGWRDGTLQDLVAAFEAAGFIGQEGALKHFEMYGAKEGVNPNRYFNARAYYVFKASQTYDVPVKDVTTKQANLVKNAIENEPSLGSAWVHFTKYGTAELVCASNEFDTGAYLTDKLRQSQRDDPANWADKTVYDMGKYISEIGGMNAVMHYFLYGRNEGLEITPVPLGDRVWDYESSPWPSQLDFLHKKIYCISDKEIKNYNLPPYYDVMLQVSPSCISDDSAGYGLSFNNALVDLKTGSLAEFLLHPRALQIGTMPIRTFTREHYNTLLDFVFQIEGRYLSFWSSLCVPCYKALMYGEPYFPEITDMEYIFGESLDGPRLYFHALNWGQAELFETTKDRILAIYTHGFTRCYWVKPMLITPMDDPRIIRVDIRDPMPKILLHDIDLITEYMYTRAKVDEFPFEFITNTITTATLEFQEDVDHAYDPWLELPPIYPDMDKAIEGGTPTIDTTAPRLISTTPGQGSNNVLPSTTIIFSFDENVVAGEGGVITITGGGKTFVIEIEDQTQVSFSGRSCVVTLQESLQFITEYTVTVDGACIRDKANNYWLGNEDDPLKFITSTESIIDTDPPELVDTIPANGQLNYPPDSVPVFTFSEPVRAGSGYVVFSTDDNDGDGYADHTVTVMASASTFEKNVVYLKLDERLRRNTEYYVTITATAFRDEWGNQYAGIQDIDAYRFKTAIVPYIWYIPDLNVSHTDDEVMALNEAVGGKMAMLEWWPMDNYKNNYDDLVSQAEDILDIDIVVGAGLGGYYAARLAASVKAQCLLLNPVINPSTQLVSQIGTWTSPDGTQYKLTQAILDSYNIATDPRITGMRNRFGLLLSPDDEILDETVAENYYPLYKRTGTTETGWSRVIDKTASGHAIKRPQDIAKVAAVLKSLGF